MFFSVFHIFAFLLLTFISFLESGRVSQLSGGSLGRIHLFLSTRSMLSFHCFVAKSCCCCSAAQRCSSPCDPTDCSTPASPVLHHLLEFAQTHVHQVGDHPIISSSPRERAIVPGILSLSLFFFFFLTICPRIFLLADALFPHFSQGRTCTESGEIFWCMCDWVRAVAGV